MSLTDCPLAADLVRRQVSGIVAGCQARFESLFSSCQSCACQRAEVEAAAPAMGVQIQILNAGTGREIQAAFAAISRERSDALFVSPAPYFVVRRVQLANLAARHAIPAVYNARDLAEAGGLMTSSNLLDCTTGRSEGFAPLRMRPV